MPFFYNENKNKNKISHNNNSNNISHKAKMLFVRFYNGKSQPDKDSTFESISYLIGFMFVDEQQKIKVVNDDMIEKCKIHSKECGGCFSEEGLTNEFNIEHIFSDFEFCTNAPKRSGSSHFVKSFVQNSLTLIKIPTNSPCLLSELIFFGRSFKCEIILPPLFDLNSTEQTNNVWNCDCKILNNIVNYNKSGDFPHIAEFPDDDCGFQIAAGKEFAIQHCLHSLICDESAELLQRIDAFILCAWVGSFDGSVKDIVTYSRWAANFILNCFSKYPSVVGMRSSLLVNYDDAEKLLKYLLLSFDNKM